MLAKPITLNPILSFTVYHTRVDHRVRFLIQKTDLELRTLLIFDNFEVKLVLGQRLWCLGLPDLGV